MSTTPLPSRYGAPAGEVREGRASALVPPWCARAGWRTVLLVTDRGHLEAGHVLPLERALREAGLAVVRHDGVTPDPTESAVHAAAQVARESGVDGIVALGGGSVLDTAKGVGFLLSNGGRMRDWAGPGAAPRDLPPMVAIPTTAGTGSEAQSFALISRDGDHVKMACGHPSARPRLVVLDPRLTVTAPPEVTLISGLDALVHAVETAVTTEATPASTEVSVRAFGRLRRHLPRVVADPGDLEARRAMLWAAHCAGQAIEASMLGASHALANPLTARFGVPHGAAVAHTLPAVIRLNRGEPAVAEVYGSLATVAGVAPGELDTDLQELAGGLGLPPLSHWGVQAHPSLVASALEQWTGRFNPVRLTARRVQALYDEILTTP